MTIDDEDLVDLTDLEHRYPVEALARMLDIELGVLGGQQVGPAASGLPALALAVGTSMSTLKRARAAGGCNVVQADRWAVACGWMPWDIWPAWALDAGWDPVVACVALSALMASRARGADGGHGLVERVGGGVVGGGGCPVVGQGGGLVWSVAA